MKTKRPRRIGWGRRWEGGEREGQDGEHMYTHGWLYGKTHRNIAHSLQLKLKKKKERKKDNQKLKINKMDKYL